MARRAMPTSCARSRPSSRCAAATSRRPSRRTRPSTPPWSRRPPPRGAPTRPRPSASARWRPRPSGRSASATRISCTRRRWRRAARATSSGPQCSPARRYTLDPEHARVLADPDDGAHVAPFAHMLAGIGQVLPRLVQAYRTGTGVPYEAYGRDFRHGQGHINRPAYTHVLPDAWLGAMPDVVERLRAGGARVADVGCGQGWSTIAVARAYPQAEVVGIDADEASIADARRHAAEAGVSPAFAVADAAALEAHGPFDVERPVGLQRGGVGDRE